MHPRHEHGIVRAARLRRDLLLEQPKLRLGNVHVLDADRVPEPELVGEWHDDAEAHRPRGRGADEPRERVERTGERRVGDRDSLDALRPHLERLLSRNLQLGIREQ